MAAQDRAEAAVMRSGRVTGTRLPMRIISTWGMCASRPRTSPRSRSDNSSGSPPERSDVAHRRGALDVVDAVEEVAEGELHRRAADLALAGAEAAVEGATGPRPEAAPGRGSGGPPPGTGESSSSASGSSPRPSAVELPRIGDALAPERDRRPRRQPQVVGGDAQGIARRHRRQRRRIETEAGGETAGSVRLSLRLCCQGSMEDHEKLTLRMRRTGPTRRQNRRL